MCNNCMYEIDETVSIRQDLATNKDYLIDCILQMPLYAGRKGKVVSWTVDNHYKLDIDGGMFTWSHDMLLPVEKPPVEYSKELIHEIKKDLLKALRILDSLEDK